MLLFAAKFPDVGRAETRVVVLEEDDPSLPAGRYAFTEYYCDELTCDCRRVILVVREESNPDRGLAAINYGWESEQFYTQWMSGDREAAREIKDASLDPLNETSEWAEALLDIFRTVLMKDPAYLKRLEQHYWMFKRAIRKELTHSFGRKARKLLKG